jgi:nucleoside 2-deoxyribosyltransferase
MKIYLAGPMRGRPEFNFPAFHAAAKVLREKGFEVFSPAEKGEEVLLDGNPGLQENLAFRRKVFKLDTTYICDEADAVVLLPDWADSKGAIAERALAVAIGLGIFDFDPNEGVRPHGA